METDARGHRKGGERGEDDLLEVLRQVGALALVELLQADQVDAVAGQRGAQLLLEAGGEAPA